MATSAAGCNKKSKGDISEHESQASAAVTDAPTEAAPTEPSVPAGINPLTGEKGFSEAACGKRPVAIMVNNLKAALPQYGIEAADIIYEVPVEGGITRLMAVYADYTAVPDVCSVRSCRYYYPLIALGMDAIYCHWGEDMTIALETLNRTGIDHIDGGYEKKMFYRDNDRVGKYATEHTGYLKGSELPELIAEKGFRTDRDSMYNETMFNFTDEPYSDNELSASKVTVNFSNAYFSTFEYDAAVGDYKKYHSGSPQIDQKTGNQLAFDNVFVFQTEIKFRDSSNYLMDVALDGGTGYYFSQGCGQSITWKKDSENAPFKVYGRDGSELKVNVGESYIGIIGSEKNISFE